VWLPSAVIYGVLGPADKNTPQDLEDLNTAAWTTIFFYLLLLGVLMLVLMRWAQKDRDLGHANSIGNTVLYPFRNGNLLAFVGLALEFYQFFSLSLQPRAYKLGYQDGMQSFSRGAFLQFGVASDEYMQVAFWIAFCVIAVWLACVGILLHALKTKRFVNVASIPGGQKIITLLSDVAYLFIIKVLFSWMACSYHQDGIGVDHLIQANVDPTTVSASFFSGAYVTLDANPLESCWTSFHSIYALLSMILLPLYIFTSSTVGIYFLEDMEGTEIKFSQSYSMTLRFFKTVIVGAVVLFSVNTVVSSSLCFVSLVCVGLFSFRLQESCSIPALRYA
jgi:hypothetical protein